LHDLANLACISGGSSIIAEMLQEQLGGLVDVWYVKLNYSVLAPRDIGESFGNGTGEGGKKDATVTIFAR
jgi:hypothetical protein